ncbi:MAG: hypothetical protein LBK08_04875 [Treponema sp.]|nr:hypothetical protein [Treponema sp.]
MRAGTSAFLRPRPFFSLFLFPLFLFTALAARPGDVRWYRSNAAGMRLEEESSRFAALRNEYALSRAPGSQAELPGELGPFFAELEKEAPPLIEVQILYQNGAEIRRQWVLRLDGVTRIAAAFAVKEKAATGAPDDSPPEEGEEGPDGFIEVFDAGGLMLREHQFAAGKETAVVYSYNGTTQVRAETSEREGDVLLPLYTDAFFYRRSGSLRRAERVYHASGKRARLSFLGGFPGADDNFISPSGYGYDMLEDVYLNEGYRIVYSTDERGRVLSESFYDENDELAGVLSNTWTEDRLTSVSWKSASGDGDRLSEFEYDDEGNRTVERDYRFGIMERTVTRDGERDIEELYMDGKIILRAVWEDGRKISEERIQTK